MNLLLLKEYLDKIPIFPLVLAFMGYLGYDYYTFTTDASSPLLMKQSEVSSLQSEIDALRQKINRMNEFGKTLDLKRKELRALAQELETTKATLSETLDMPELMKTLLIEAKRAGLTVTSLKPLEAKTEDFYAEQAFEFNSTGIFFQYVAFLDRIANLQKIIRVDHFAFSPASSSSAKYVQLKSSVQFKAYKYVGSKADEAARGAGLSAGTPKPASSGGRK